MLSATPNEGQYSGNTLNIDLGAGGGGPEIIYLFFEILIQDIMMGQSRKTYDSFDA